MMLEIVGLTMLILKEEPSKYQIHGLQMRLKIMMLSEDHKVGVKVPLEAQEKILVHQLGDIKEQTPKVNSIMIIIKPKMIGVELKLAKIGKTLEIIGMIQVEPLHNQKHKD